MGIGTGAMSGVLWAWVVAYVGKADSVVGCGCVAMFVEDDGEDAHFVLGEKCWWMGLRICTQMLMIRCNCTVLICMNACCVMR